MGGIEIVLPGVDSDWVLVAGGTAVAQGATPSELAEGRTDVIVGLPASLVSIFSVTLPETDPALHESMLYSQLEKRGLSSHAEGAAFDFERISGGSDGDLFLVTAVSGLPGELILPRAAGYASTASLREVPEGGCLVWKEHGRLALGVYRGPHPVHLQMLSGSGQIDERAGKEVALVLLSLEADAAMEESAPTMITVAVPDSEPGGLDAFSTAAGLPVTVSSPYATVPRPEGRERLLPGAVLRARKSRRLCRQAIFAAAVLLVAYAVMVSWLWQTANERTTTIESLKKRIAIVEPDAERIQQIEQRWRKLEPAFEKDWFPMVQLSRISSALPGSGVVVREFRTVGRDIRLRGQARDVQFANRLLEDLKGMEEFSGYSWTMPNPRVEQNNTAVFEMEGKSKNAGADN